MSDGRIPKSWVSPPLSDVVEEVSPIDPGDLPETTFTYFDIGSIDNRLGVALHPKKVLGGDAPSRARQAVRPGDILFSTVRPGLGAIAQVPEARNAVASTAFCVIRTLQGVEPRFLYHLVRSDRFVQTVLPYQRGVSYPAVRPADITSQQVPIPPTAEQQRVIERLEALLSDLDAGVAELEAAQKKLARYRQSLLKAAVEGTLTADWRAERARRGDTFETGPQLLERILRDRRARWEEKQLAKFEAQGKAPPKGWREGYDEAEPPATSGLFELPNGWQWVSLGQLLSDLRSGSAETSGREATAFPILKSSAVRPSQIDFSAVNYLRPDQCKRENYLRAGDLLITRLSGSVEYVGCAAVVHSLPLEGIQYPDRVFCGKVLPLVATLAAYLAFALGSAYARERIEVAAKSTAGHKRISLSDLLPFPIPLPPIEEAVEIARRISDSLMQIEETEEALVRGLRHASAQRQNILRAAFSGRLVPQDPTDEPASALLERIRAARATGERTAKTPRGRRKASAPA